MKLPNPFDPALDIDHIFAASDVPAAEQATGIVGDASVPVATHHETPLPPEPESGWQLDEAFMERLYADIVGENDALPVFLRRPSPAFIRTLIEMGR